MVNFIGGASAQDDNALENGDDQLRVQACLQEGVELRLLHKLLKLVELDHSVPTTSHMEPQVPESGSDQLVSHATHCNEKAEEGHTEANGVFDVPCGSDIVTIAHICVVSVDRLRVVDEGALKQGVNHDELEVALLN